MIPSSTLTSAVWSTMGSAIAEAYFLAKRSNEVNVYRVVDFTSIGCMLCRLLRIAFGTRKSISIRSLASVLLYDEKKYSLCPAARSICATMFSTSIPLLSSSLSCINFRYSSSARILASLNACEIKSPVSAIYNLREHSSVRISNPTVGSVAAKHVLMTRDSSSQKKAVSTFLLLVPFPNAERRNFFSCFWSCAGMVSKILVTLASWLLAYLLMSLRYNDRIFRFVLSTSSKSLVSTQSFTACGMPPTIIYRRIYSIIFRCSD